MLLVLKQVAALRILATLLCCTATKKKKSFVVESITSNRHEDNSSFLGELFPRDEFHSHNNTLEMDLGEIGSLPSNHF